MNDTTTVHIDQVFSLQARYNEMIRRIRNGGMKIGYALDGMQAMLDGKFPASPVFTPPSWYVDPDVQIRKVQDLLLHSIPTGFGFLDIPPVPDFSPQTPSEVLLLALYLHDEGPVLGVQRTFDVLWNLVVPPRGYVKVHMPFVVKNDSEHLRLTLGINHCPGIRWVGFDPNANVGRSPQACWDDPRVAPTLAGPEVLMAMALFPNWVLSWEDYESPYPNLSGYQHFIDGNLIGAPCFSRSDVLRRIELEGADCDSTEDNCSSPVFRVL